MLTDDLIAAARVSKAWPFQEAMKLVKRYPDGKRGPDGALVPVLFETGYGPSGLPHIGTFQEVLRTTLVRRAYEVLTGGAPTRLVAFSDDMDGLRKVPDNVPNKDVLTANLGKPLTRIPDPFGTHASFAHHNNARLCAFLDQFGFDYEFISASDCYNGGQFDEALRQVLRHYDAIMDIMLPTLREERRRTYSPVLPVSPTSGVVLQVPVEVIDAEAGIVRFVDEGQTIEQCIFGGQAKLQWKVDWAMRWYALGVDYEMCGKDLTDSVTQSGKIVRELGGRKPEGLIYELFLDAKGEKISKSKGNGLSIEEWLTYGPPESLSLFMFQQPKAAKRLHFDVIPRHVDDYLSFVERYPAQNMQQRLDNPVFHIHSGNPPAPESNALPFNILLNLASVANTEDKAVLWGFISRYAPQANPQANPMLDRLVGHAIAYFRDKVKPTRVYRAPTDAERKALADLDTMLAGLPEGADATAIQNQIYEIGKRPDFADLKAWFQCLYETLLGSSQGPRMGSFVALYGVPETRALIAKALSGALVK